MAETGGATEATVPNTVQSPARSPMATKTATSTGPKSKPEDHFGFRMHNRHTSLMELWNEWHGLGDYVDSYGGIEGRNKEHGRHWRKKLDSTLYSATSRIVMGVKAYATSQKKQELDVLREWEPLFQADKRSTGMLVKTLQAKELIKKGKPRGLSKKRLLELQQQQQQEQEQNQ
ncbi:unknown protein [Seminavis robusta]|uniref:Transcription activator GCR1-like domain-containing protein n=1 Tax=Seminavis robusta TaxID=568900 RepID=A0A9N8EPK8_9STRA|nr:unknown protein [Seminavis robusta]|eukprot:Sro1348_g265000.1 n/a (174) ;mRNA; r:7032-7553